ncbi:recombinase family protein [Gimesia maris]|uniref:recombinase family protein n=1 Tax=Gimesia maris TaxID=122 RepID=UPI0032ECAAA0
MSKHIAIYVRVSSKTQDHRSQLPDLERWADSQDEPIKWYKDKASGKTMNRPGWNELESNIRSGKVSQVVVWRLDRLGRTASGLTSLFDELQIRKVNLVSIKDGLDLSTAAGRLMANVLASVAQYDNEVRSERQAAGIAKAKAQGKKWGGSKKGTRTKVTDDRIEIIRHMKEKGKPITAIAKAVGLSRPTIYGVLEQF